jgi:hypothetical protein
MLGADPMTALHIILMLGIIAVASLFAYHIIVEAGWQMGI